MDFVFPGSLFRLSGFFINFSFLDYLGYWILSSQVFYFVFLGSLFRILGLFGILDFGFLDYLGYWCVGWVYFKQT
ncbi:unnamed protein product [Rhizophagus irregularis]|nr:unnamed protein product [Rhizophagus irregularis]